MVARADPGPAEHGAEPCDEDDIGLRASPVEGQDGRRGSGGAQPRTDVTLRCVGTKVVVVGGGSTYTPELVDGLCDVEDRMAVDDLVLLDPSDQRREVVGGLSERILRHAGMGRDLLDDGRPARSPRGGRLRRGPAPHRRAGGAPRRRDAAGRLRMSGAGDRGRRWAWPRRCAPCPSSWDWPRRWRPVATRARGWSTSPTRSGSSPRRCSTRATAPWACATWPSGPSAGSGTISASTPIRSTSSMSG